MVHPNLSHNDNFGPAFFAAHLQTLPTELLCVIVQLAVSDGDDIADSCSVAIPVLCVVRLVSRHILTVLETVNLVFGSLSGESALGALQMRQFNVELTRIHRTWWLSKLDFASVGNVFNVAALAQSRLTTLILDSTDVTDFSTLRHCSSLQKLSLELTMLTSLRELQGLTALRDLNITGTAVKDIECLAEFPCLEDFRMGDTEVADVSPAVHCAYLKKLFLEFTMVSDVSILPQFKELTVLNLIGCDVLDFSELRKCQKLETLYVDRSASAESLARAGLFVSWFEN